MLYGEKDGKPGHPRRHGAGAGGRLSAQGKSIIRNIGQIDRGYERVEQKLTALGARIERQTEK